MKRNAICPGLCGQGRRARWVRQLPASRISDRRDMVNVYAKAYPACH
jgi:hypothetical protein